MKHDRNFTGADNGHEEPTPAELQAEAWADCLELCGHLALMAREMGVSITTVRKGLRGEKVSENTADRFSHLYHDLLERELDASREWMGY